MKIDEQWKTHILIGLPEFSIIMSLNSVTGAHDQSLESSQSDWTTKFCNLFWQVGDKQENFCRKIKLFHEKSEDRSNLNRVKHGP